MSKNYHEGFQSTLGMAMPMGELPTWVSTEMDIGNKYIESAYTKFTEAISVNTARKKKFLCLFVNTMENIDKLEKDFSEKKINKTKKTKKKPGHENKTRRPKKFGGNAYVSTDASCDTLEMERTPADNHGWNQGMGELCITMEILQGLIKDPAEGDYKFNMDSDDEDEEDEDKE
jgi:hypothetical protein